MLKKIAVTLGVFALVAAGGPANAQNKCAGTKIKVAGKKAACLLGLESKEASKGALKDPLKVAKCEDKLSAAFAKADLKGGCLTTGDAAGIEGKVDALVDDVDTEISGAVDPPASTSKCQSGKLKAAGKKAKCILGLRAKVAAKGGSVDPLKLQKCLDKYTGAWTKAELAADCGAATGDVAVIEAKVDAFIDDANDELEPAVTTTTTITTTTTTSTTAPPVTTTTTSTTTTTTICNCCPAVGSVLRFTTGLPAIGGGGCGNVKDSGNAVLLNIDCGGLYTGGGGTTLPLPSVVPDTGQNYVRTTGCVGNNYNLAPTVPGDHPAAPGPVSILNCTSAGISDPIYPACDSGTRAGLPCVTNLDCPPAGICGGGGASMTGCLFGPPLPLPNSTFVGASVCVINRVVVSASGSGACNLGTTNLALPLGSDLYLEGDLLDGSAGDRPAVAGIQPCPICDGTLLCKGGPRHGLPCAPQDSAVLGAAYPTSHDCPPPPGALGSAYIGALPIPFNLTTDPTGTLAANHKVASFINGQEVFCGFCSNFAGTVWKNPPFACTTNAMCAAGAGTGCPGTVACNTCKQRTSGAFGTASASPGAEHEITLFGSPAGACLADLAPHASTLVSAFCIPPAYNATVDANGDLPGPGATALGGTSQLFP